VPARSRLRREPMSSVRQLQRAVGNQTMGRVLRSVRIVSGAAPHVQREIEAAPRPTIAIGHGGRWSSSFRHVSTQLGPIHRSRLMECSVR
jgi:hypothetical protein